MRNITRESIQSDLDALLPELRGPLAAAIDDNDDGGETLWFIVLSETFHPMLTAGPATRSVYKKTLPYFGLPED